LAQSIFQFYIAFANDVETGFLSSVHPTVQIQKHVEYHQQNYDFPDGEKSTNNSTVKKTPLAGKSPTDCAIYHGRRAF